MPDYRDIRTVDISTEVDHRLHRVEEAVAALQDTHLMEDRVAERVVQRLRRSPITDSASVIVESGHALVPQPIIPPANDNSHSATIPPPGRAVWMFLELWMEARTFGRMLFDHRYPFSFSGRFGPLLIAFAYVFFWFFIGSLPLVGTFFERLVDIVLAVVLYKILSREVRRYRAMFPQ